MSNGMTAKKAYRAGWEASKNTRTYDLDAAEARFRSRHGDTFEDQFTRGWVDYAADKDYAPPSTSGTSQRSGLSKIW